MKKSLQIKLAVVLGAVAGILISLALTLIFGFSPFQGRAETLTRIDIMNNTELNALAYAVVRTIKDGDYAALSRFTHPETGVLFSPQATVSPSANKSFSASEIAAFGSDTTTCVWGLFSESGEPIEMTPGEYFGRFVYDKDFISAPYIGINRIVRSSNALENISDVFPGIRFVEFNMPDGEQSQTGEAGWDSLRLGFEEYGGSVRLTVITHSESSA